MKYKAQAPLRIDFGGGWTDVPLFAEAEPEGGAVLNAAINRYASGFIQRPEEAQGFDGLVSRIRREKHQLHYEIDAPAGAGLGASAAQTLLWLTLVKTTIANVSERRELAERAWRVENELGIFGGKQDQYASAVGGINFMTFGVKTLVEPVSPGFPFVEDLERRLVLVYTGRRRLSGDIHDAVWGGYRRGETRVVNALRRLRAIAHEMCAALMAHDFDGFADLLEDNWTQQKMLHSSVTNDAIDHLVDLAMRSGAMGGKSCGAGGGGCLVFLARDGAETALAEALTRAGAQPIPFKFDWYGVYLTKG